MSNRAAPKMAKWVFLLADLLLLAGCAWVLLQFLSAKSPYAPLVAVVAIVGWMYGAWVCILPWLEEYRAETRLLENQKLAEAVAQIKRLEEVAQNIQAATGSWHSAQEAAARTAGAAREIEEKMKSGMKEFIDFNERINNDEKKHLRLEVEKLRRAEADWLQAIARMLDHTFALTQAAVRSGQPNLRTQMMNFQNSCRDAVRRLGLAVFHPGAGDAFDERLHQMEDANKRPAEGEVISDVLATGFTFQGQLLRRALVKVAAPEPPPLEEPVVENVEPPPSTENLPTEQPIVAEAPTEPEVEPEVKIVETVASVPEEPAAPTPEEARPPEPDATEPEAPASAVEDDPPKRSRRVRKPDPQSSLPF